MELAQLQKALDAIEEQEFKLLSWGDTDGYFTEDEIFNIIETSIPDEYPEDVLDELIRKAFIVSVKSNMVTETVYRSRMAHGVYLFRNLRQWMHGQKLEASKSLISDFRFLRRQRYYPLRNISSDSLISQCNKEGLSDSLVHQALRNQIGKFQLSGFQVRSTLRTLKAWNKHKIRTRFPSATITCAGTGGGKTMAFYLPALSALTKDIIEDNSQRVRVLALYPRQELLKDQFNETWSACRKLDEITLNKCGRKIRIGALFGNTPHEARYALKNNKDYFHSGLVQCGTKGCDGEMRWNKSDIEKNNERLVCHLCSSEINSEEVALTRKSIENNPPDILFTTTEMLNFNLGNPKRQHLFGIKTQKPIPLVLLDEVHTYSGNQGAQTAYLLRRWMKVSNSSPHFVGLSATLSDAENFFANLTGTNISRVKSVEPLTKEMESEGAEYLLALRGDPVSQTALLSTTIQSAMLTRRILDHHKEKPSESTWGTKTFIFTDDLDANNRLFSQLADAEGWWQRGNRLVHNSSGPLAKLRNPNDSEYSQETLLAYGQDWSALKYHGFSLNDSDRANVSRTSSQDVGVDKKSDVVVATATLEVGFNDSEVGAVIQHKAPRNVASYLQRKGRAGRSRETRPWTVIVLSEFGQDRETFQHYERLLDPEIKMLGLPIDNIHIHKMQSAMATLDWLSVKMNKNYWLLLNQPKDNKTGDIKSALTELLTIVDETILSGSRLQSELSDYLKNALQLTEPQVNSVLWQSPRPILLEFLPTLRKNITTHWGVWDVNHNKCVPWKDHNERWGSPVPDFIPDQLFSDLNLPAVDIGLVRQNNEVYWENMRFFQAMKEFAPGRISKRFSTYSGQSSDWLVPENFEPSIALHNTSQPFDIESAFGPSLNEIGEFKVKGESESIKVYKPYQIYPKSMFNQKVLSETSNAFLQWQSEFIPGANSEYLSPPSSNIWSRHLEQINFYTHRTMTPIDIIRFNLGSESELKFKRTNEKAKINFNWRKENKQVGIGTRLTVDAMRFTFKIGSDNFDSWLNDKELVSVLRTSYLQDKIRKSNICEQNIFMSDWLFECFLAIVSLESIKHDGNVKKAIELVLTDKSSYSLNEIPSLLFQQDMTLTSHEGEDSVELRDQKLQQALIEKLASPIFIKQISELANILYCELVEHHDFKNWAKKILGNTLSAGIQQMVCTAMPQIDEKTLIVDPVFDDDLNTLTIWLSEQDSGGSGVITQLQDLYADDPHRILGILTRSFEPGDYERLDSDLNALLRLSQENTNITDALYNLRDSKSHHQRIDANKALKLSLIKEGFQFSHSFSAVLHSRIVKSGSSSESDKNLFNYMSKWKEIEHLLGFELPMNIIGFLLATQNSSIESTQIFDSACKIQSVLWPRGSAVRQSVLSFYNQFKTDGYRTERLLAAQLCRDDISEVSLHETDWLSQLHELIREHGVAKLVIPQKLKTNICKAISELHVTPVDTNGLFFYPRVKSVQYKKESAILTIELAEAVV
ncbi:protein DpdJ [Thalassotalea crassostreae]|uniref:protein DpdJ n=1 Tax=Thalassotalea crassostreae TaxID=1763536 RepID=UPI000838F4F1|nr:protein DpdJ [Thalassotalea crassostreae]